MKQHLVLLVTFRSVTSQLVTCHTDRFVKQPPGKYRDYYHRKMLMVLGETQVLETRVIIILVTDQFNAQNLVL